MPYSSVFQLVAEEFSQAKIPYILIGGFAVNYYKVERHTSDVDFLISENKAQKADAILNREGYHKENSQEAFAIYKNSNPILMNVDLILVSPETLESIQQKATRITIMDQHFLVPSLEHLIALKLHAIKNNPAVREAIDLLDIVRLIQENKIDMKTDKFRNLCNQYGSEGIYDRILSFIHK